MTASLRIFYNSLGTPEMYAMIRERLGRTHLLITLDSDEDGERVAKIADCDVAIVAATPLTAEVIAAGSKLRLIHHQGVGYHDTVDLGAARAAGLRLATTPEGTSIGVAEHTVLLTLGAARRAAFADAELRQGRWHVNALRPVSVELFGKTVGFIGFGRIGQEAAARFAAFGTRIVYHDPEATVPNNLIARSAGFEEVIAEADVLTLHLPLTVETRHLISAQVLAWMKPSAILVNTARGGIVDDAALAEALAGGKLLAAGLDVFEGEPVGADHPLASLPNVFLTPHISAGTRDALRHKMDAIAANLDRFAKGEPLRNEIDLSC